MAGTVCTLVVRLAVVGLQKRSNWRCVVMGSESGSWSVFSNVVDGLSREWSVGESVREVGRPPW